MNQLNELLERVLKAPPAARYGGLAGLLVAIFAASFFLLIQPVEQSIEATDKNLANLNRQLAEKKEIAQNLNERRREMDKLQSQLEEALTQLPERKDIEELLAQLNDIGRKSGLEISKVEPGSESSQAFFARIPIRMNVSGNYHEIATFMQEVSNMRRIVNVNNIKLSGATMKNDKVVLSSEFLATTFRFVDKPPPAKPAKGGKKK